MHKWLQCTLYQINNLVQFAWKRLTNDMKLKFRQLLSEKIKVHLSNKYGFTIFFHTDITQSKLVLYDRWRKFVCWIEQFISRNLMVYKYRKQKYVLSSLCLKTYFWKYFHVHDPIINTYLSLLCKYTLFRSFRMIVRRTSISELPKLIIIFSAVILNFKFWFTISLFIAPGINDI